MSISDKGVEFIASFEGFNPVAVPDPASGGEPFLIGYFTTTYPDGTKVKLGDSCTEKQALSYLKYDIESRIMIMQKLSGEFQNKGLSQNMYDALASFVFNMGWSNFISSSFCEAVRKDPYNFVKIRTELKKWNKAAGKVMPGLAQRREAEADLYEFGVYHHPWRDQINN